MTFPYPPRKYKVPSQIEPTSQILATERREGGVHLFYKWMNQFKSYILVEYRLQLTNCNSNDIRYKDSDINVDERALKEIGDPICKETNPELDLQLNGRISLD